MPDRRLGSMVIEDTGAGPPVVMVHGLGGSSGSFETLMGIVDGYRVVRPDLPGAGRSGLRPGQAGIAGLVAALRDCLRALSIDRAHLVGHSMGTLVAQHLAAGQPEAVASLCLFGPILEPPAPARQALAERAATARATGMADIADGIARGSVARSAAPAAAAFVRESVIRQDPRGYARHCEALAAASAADHGAIRCPTTLVAGEEDSIAPPSMARALAARIAGARLTVLEGAGHWIMVESPQRSGELLRAHLDDAATTSGAHEGG